MVHKKSAWFPIDRHGWLLLWPLLGSKVKIRAVEIKKKKHRVTDFDGHEIDEADAKSGVKVCSKLYDIRGFKK